MGWGQKLLGNAQIGTLYSKQQLSVVTGHQIISCGAIN